MAEHGCSAVCFQAVLHGRIILTSQHSELSSLLGIQAPRPIHHLPSLLLSSFLWTRPSSSMETPQFYQQNPEQREQHVLWWSGSCGEEEEEEKKNKEEKELLGL